MSDIRNLSKQFIADFIELYQSLPCLWKIKSKEYSDRNKKHAAYLTMVNKLKEVEADADRDAVIRKINSLRSSYRKEKKKVLESQKSGAGADEVHVPTLWYYSLFNFLDDQEIARPSVSNFEESLSHDENSIESVVSPQDQEYRPPSQSSNNSSCTTDPSPQDLDLLPPTPSSECASAPPRRVNNNKRGREIDNVIATVGKKLSEARTEDQHDVFGRNVAHKLRNMPKEQRIFAEKLINDALFEGDLGTLSRNCCIHIPTTNTTPLQIPTQPIFVNAIPSNMDIHATPSQDTHTTTATTMNSIETYVAAHATIGDYVTNYHPEQ